VLPHGHKVEYASRSRGMDSQQILSFYMGKNTPERKDYIMENLVVTVEERRACALTPRWQSKSVR